MTVQDRAFNRINEILSGYDGEYALAGQYVELAVSTGLGLVVEMDPGAVELAGEDLALEWEALAPGEGFYIRSVFIPGSS